MIWLRVVIDAYNPSTQTTQEMMDPSECEASLVCMSSRPAKGTQ